MKTISVPNYPIFSFEFFTAYVITMRPYLLFVSGITGIAGIALSGNNDLLRVILISIAAFLSYGFGQALTDCFQIDTDSISSPYRPLTQGLINKTQVMSISVVGLLFCISIFSYYNPIVILLGIISAFGLITYTTFKRKWWGGPFYNSWIVAVLLLMSFYAASGNITTEISFNLTLTISTVFFGYANFVLSGYFKDISADRATGYITLPVKFGRKVSAFTSDSFAILAGVSAGLIILYNIKTNLSVPAIIFYTTSIILSLISQIKLHNVKTDEEAHPAISLTVHSYILLLSSIAIIYRPSWVMFLTIYYILFNVVMKLRPSKLQV
jgi:4-hydroxybenzoate polyprenyltransferase